MLGFPFRLENLRAGRNHHSNPNPEADREKVDSPPQGARCHSHWSWGEQRVEGGLEAYGLPRIMGEILKSAKWGYGRELVTGEMDRIYASTIRGRPDRWNAELWGSVYGLNQGWEGMATKRENCTRDIFSLRLDPKYGYFVKDCKDERKMMMLAFLVPIFSQDKPYNILTSFLPSPPTCFSHTPRRKW